MALGWLGLPWLAWAAIAGLIAALFTRVWPRTQAAAARGARWWLLRWGHALVWLLLGLAALARAAGLNGDLLAAGAGLTYGAFLVAVLRR